MRTDKKQYIKLLDDMKQYQLKLMDKRVQVVILSLQLGFFALGRILDDLTWHDVGVANEVSLFEALSIGCMVICFVMHIVRKRKIDGIWWILFLRSQLAFFIPYALQITTIILYFSAFSCQDEIPQNDIGYFYVTYPGCCLTATQIMLTTINYSLVCNTKTEWGQFFGIQIILFAEIIYAGHLLLYSINHLEHEPKDYALFLLTIIIANQMLMMDLIFRAAYEDRQREEAKEKQSIEYYRTTFTNRSKSTRVHPNQMSQGRELTLSLRG